MLILYDQRENRKGEGEMGTFDVAIQVADFDGEHFEEMQALVDTGATFTVVPQSVLRSLEIEPEDRKSFMYASGERVELDLAQVRIRVDGRETITWVIFGDAAGGAMLGAYTLEGVLLGVDPHNQQLIPVEGLIK